MFTHAPCCSIVLPLESLFNHSDLGYVGCRYVHAHSPVWREEWTHFRCNCKLTQHSAASPRQHLLPSISPFNTSSHLLVERLTSCLQDGQEQQSSSHLSIATTSGVVLPACLVPGQVNLFHRFLLPDSIPRRNSMLCWNYWTLLEETSMFRIGWHLAGPHLRWWGIQDLCVLDFLGTRSIVKQFYIKHMALMGDIIVNLCLNNVWSRCCFNSDLCQIIYELILPMQKNLSIVVLAAPVGQTKAWIHL